ncbi:MAG: hypothetical protein K2M48_01820, partial [Clostridiales bacterium]|nr:hypothetical protein [Clostridiales bacterium]
LCAMPLLACGDDDEWADLQGEWVSEREWVDGIDALLDCKNYTETIKVRVDSETLDQSYKGTVDALYKFDIDNKVMFFTLTAPKVENPNIAPTSYSTYAAYEFCYAINDPNSDEPVFRDICVYRYEEDEDGWQVRDLGTIELSNFKKNFIDSNLTYSIIYGLLDDSSVIKIKSIYSDFKYSGETGAFTHLYEREFNEPPYGSSSISQTTKLYFSNKRLYAVDYKSRGETKATVEGKDYHIIQNQSGTDVCSDFGTTVIEVPDEVKTVLENYKATHSPNAE